MSANYDAFFSYRRKDRDRAMPLFSALARAGIRVWRDESDLSDFDPITPAIRNAIAGSKALIAFYSADYSLSRACFEELSIAWLAAQQSGELPYSRVLVVNPETGFDHIATVLRDQQSIPWPQDSSGLADLVSKIRAHIAPLTGTLHQAIIPVRPQHHPLALMPAPRFIGRTRELWDLHGQLTADRMSIITGVFGRTASQVCGMGGNGKSMLAREYAIRFGPAFPGGVFWINAYGNDDSKGPLNDASREALRCDQIRVFAQQSGVEIEGLKPEQIETAFWERLKEVGQRCLWIVDDLPSGFSVQQIEGHWAAQWDGASTLITTRSTEYGSMGSTINLHTLTETEALLLLTCRRLPQTHEERAAAYEIVRRLGFHALAVEVAGSFLGKGFKTYAGYLEAFDQPDSDAVEFGARIREVLPTGHERSISSTLMRSVRMLGPAGLAFLELASALAGAPVPVSLVEAAFRQWPAPCPDVVMGIDEADSLGLSRCEGDDARSVHTLVSRAVQRYAVRNDSSGAWLRARLTALRALFEVLPDAVVDVRWHTEIRREMAHARHLIASGLNDGATTNVGQCVARHDFESGDYGSARRIYQQVLEAVRSLLGAEHSETLTMMNDLAVAMRAQGDLAGARRLLEQVLQGRRQVLGAEHAHTLATMNALAETLNAQGDLAGARQLHEQVLEVFRRLLGLEHRHTLAAINNLAGTLMAQGDSTGARQCYEQVLEAVRRVLGAEHPDTLTAMNNLAEAMRTQGDLAGARQLQEQVLEARQCLLGAEHPHTLTAMNNLAAILRGQGELARARQLQECALGAFRRRLGTSHPDTLRMMNNLASTLGGEGDLEGARQLQEQVLEAFGRLLGREHPDTLMTMNNLALTLRRQGDLASARQLLEQVLLARRRVLGPEHPDTLAAMNNLAFTLRDQGEMASARQLLEQVLQACRRLLGAEHPRTLAAMINLATTLKDEGDLASAQRLEAHVLEAVRRLGGVGHAYPALE